MARIKELRKRKGISVEKLAEILDISAPYLYDLEKGRRRLHEDIIKKLCNYFGVSADYLLGYTGKRHDAEIVPIVSDAYPASKFIPLPIYGVIRAGAPIYAEENIIGYEWVPEEEVKGGDYFFLKVTGDSMKDAGIFDGSLVLARKQPIVDNGSIAVVLIKDSQEATVKKFYSKDGMIILKPENPDYNLQIYRPEEVMVLGEVVQAIRKFK